MATHSEDIELLVDVVKNRQKFPRPCVRAFDRLSNAASDTTERIFFDTGGVSAWATYVLTKKASEGTGHVPGRSKRRQLLARIEASPIDARKELVTRLAVALEPDRERVEQLVKVARQQPNRARRSAQQSRETSTVRKTTEDGSEVEDYVDAQEGHETQDGSSGSPNEQIPRSPSRPPQTFTRALAARCGQLFPPYLAASIRRDSNHSAIISILPTNTAQNSEYILKLEITRDTIGYIAMELFGAHLEANSNQRYVYLMGTTRAQPDPALLLQGCRATAVPELLGTQVAAAIFATETHQAESLGGHPCMSCVTMRVSGAASDGAEICLLLPAKEAMDFRNLLFA